MANPQMRQFAKADGTYAALTADGDTEVVSFSRVDAEWPARVATILALGTFGGGTLSIQFSGDGGVTWGAVTTLTTNGGVSISVGEGMCIKGTLTGSTGASLKLWVG